MNSDAPIGIIGISCYRTIAPHWRKELPLPNAWDWTATLSPEAARASAAYSSVMDTKGLKMLTRNFRPQSHISQTLKDAELILEQARRRGLHLPVTAVQTDPLHAAIALEGPDSDSSAVIEAIRRPAINEVAP